MTSHNTDETRKAGVSGTKITSDADLFKGEDGSTDTSERTIFPWTLLSERGHCSYVKPL